MILEKIEQSIELLVREKREIGMLVCDPGRFVPPSSFLVREIKREAKPAAKRKFQSGIRDPCGFLQVASAGNAHKRPILCLVEMR